MFLIQPVNKLVGIELTHCVCNSITFKQVASDCANTLITDHSQAHICLNVPSGHSHTMTNKL